MRQNIKKRLRDFLSIPDYAGDLTQKQLAEVLQGYFISLFVLNVVGIPATVFVFREKIISGGIMFFCMLASFLSWWLIKRSFSPRKIALAAYLTFLTMVTTLVIFTGGIESPAIIYYIPLTASAGLFFGGRVAFLSGITSLLLAFTLYLAESNGFIFPDIFSYPPISRLVTLLFATSTTILPLFITLQKMKNAIQRAEYEISERKKVEAALRELNNELEQRVQEQTARYDVTSKELAELSYAISHDLRSPVRGVHGFSNLLLQSESGNISEEGKKLLRHITTSAERMGLLVDGLIWVSRIASHPLSAQETDLTALVTQLSYQLDEKFPERKLQWRIAPGLVAIADQYLMQIVVEQLLDNAVKFTVCREEAVIEFGAVGEATGQTIYFIRDNGSGFDLQHTAMLFKTFHRLHRDDEYPGIGLGMALTQRIINRHGGNIWAHGEVNRGATFYFTLDEE